MFLIVGGCFHGFSLMSGCTVMRANDYSAENNQVYCRSLNLRNVMFNVF